MHYIHPAFENVTDKFQAEILSEALNGKYFLRSYTSEGIPLVDTDIPEAGRVSAAVARYIGRTGMLESEVISGINPGLQLTYDQAITTYENSVGSNQKLLDRFMFGAAIPTMLNALVGGCTREVGKAGNRLLAAHFTSVTDDGIIGTFAYHNKPASSIATIIEKYLEVIPIQMPAVDIEEMPGIQGAILRGEKPLDEVVDMWASAFMPSVDEVAVLAAGKFNVG